MSVSAAMKPSILCIIVAVAFAAAVSVPAAARAADRVIEISGFAYSSIDVVAQAGDRVTWINRDIVAHTASAVNGGWDSGEIPPGGKVSLLLPAGYDRDYYCVYHPNMRGRL